jgi:hypothetical protein
MFERNDETRDDILAEMDRLSPNLINWLMAGPSEVASITALMILTARTMGAFISRHNNEDDRKICFDYGVGVISSEMTEAIDRIDAAGLSGPLTAKPEAKP